MCRHPPLCERRAQGAGFRPQADLWEGKTPSGTIGDPPGMLDLFRVLLPTLAAIFHEGHDLVVENLLVRHQLQVAVRSRPRPHLKTRDRFVNFAALR